MEIKNIIDQEKLMEEYTKNSPDKWQMLGFAMIPHKALLDKRLSKPAKLVYWNLSMHTFKGKKDCNPSQKRIASEIDYSKNTVIKAIAELEKFRYIRVERSPRNSRKVNRYIPLIKHSGSAT